ncbi:MAG: hypothetical protein IJE59_03270 [Clostridia bacterium]|nr:hypothetical protein [Clostridia bacterium]
MKTHKTIKIVTIILLVLIISLASFLGAYKKEEYRVINIIPEFMLGMEFTDSRVVNFEVNKEKNVEEKLTVENYKQTKSIVKNRLKNLGVDQYRVVLDETTGNIQVRIPENDNTEEVIYYLLQSGTFELKDSKTDEVLINTSFVKNADVVYSQGETQTTVFLQIKFNKDAKQKLEELKNTYKSITEETTSEESKDTEETKSIELYLNGEMVTEINLEDSYVNEMLYIGIGAGSNAATLEQYRIIAKEAATVLNSGVLPITYTETDYIEESKITNQQKNIAMYIALGIVAFMIVIFIIGLRTKGILASILQIGYIASLLLVLRYTNVKITFEGVCGIALASIINFVYIYKAFKNLDINFVKDITAKFALKLIPIYIIAIILSFNSIANIYSLGMTLVWGSIVMYLYNLTLTQITLKTIKK